MLGSITVWGQVLKWGGLALVIAGATWWLLSTVSRAREADALEARLVVAEAQARAAERFNDQVRQLQAVVDTRMGEFVTERRETTQRVIERIIREVPAGNPCFSRETVQILNSRRGVDGRPQ